MEKRPLVVSTEGAIERLQPGDCLSDTVTPDDHNRLRHSVRRLILYLLTEGIEIPEDILKEFNIE